MPTFAGFDHLDVRVRSLALVEPFYDRLLSELGLGSKVFAFVDELGDWHTPDGAHAYNAVEYHETPLPGRPDAFIGFIEEPAMLPSRSRIALRIASKADLRAYEPRLRAFGAHDVEVSSDFDGYPAIFFEDPAGTRLELCARNLKAAPGGATVEPAGT